MSSGKVCDCKGPRKDRMKNWRVVDYKCNYSAFNGNRYTPSEYSCITCLLCSSYWRTKMPYVNSLARSKGVNEKPEAPLPTNADALEMIKSIQESK